MSDAFVFSASIIIEFTMRMTGASPAASSEASNSSALPVSTAETSTSVSCPRMTFSSASAGFAASSFALTRASASATSLSSATTLQMLPPATRATSSRDGRSNGSAKATVRRPATFTSGRAFAFDQNSTPRPHRSASSGMKPGGSASGGIEK